jgi:AraC-like DNA-binding protein
LSVDDRDLSLRTIHVPIRAATLRGFAALVRELGSSSEGLLAAHGLDEEQIARGDNIFIGFDTVEALLEAAADQCGAPDFGLRLAAQQDIRILGPLAIAMENAGTVGETVDLAARYLFIHSPAISLKRITDPAGALHVIGLRYASVTGNSSPQTVDYGFGMVHRVLTVLNGGEPYGLRSAYLPHPRLADLAAYTRYFHAEVRFDQPEAVLRVPTHLMSVPVRGGSEMLRSIATEYLETHFVTRAAPVAEFVFDILDDHRGPDSLGVPEVAKLLCLHPRALQRLLLTEGFTFNGIADDVRRHQAWELITATAVPFSQVASRVGLREQSSLTRAVRRWFGVSPSELRRSPGGDQPPRLTRHSASPDA